MKAHGSAVSAGHQSTVEELIGAGADVNRSGVNFSYSPTMLKVAEGKMIKE